MQNSFLKTVALLSASILFLAIAVAAQTTTTPSAASAAQQTPAAKTAAAGNTKKPRPAVAAKTAPLLALTTSKDKASYAIGMNIGNSLKKDSVDVNTALILRGMKDTLAGGKMLLTEDEAKAAMVALQTDVRKRQDEKMATVGDANKKEGDAFLEANKTKQGVMTLPSGLQYKILAEGSGPKPALTDSVVCNYKGTLINGTEFDSSYKRGQPATFPVNQVIKGWTEALQIMSVGSKWQLYIPSDLAYGQRGAGADIGPNSTLIFDIELISIQGK